MSKNELLHQLEMINQAAKMLNLERHGREDCKSCALVETLDQLIAEAYKDKS